MLNSFGQTQSNQILNFDQPGFTKIVDGFQAKDGNFPVIKINSVKRSDDTLYLKLVGLQLIGKPYMIINSEILPIRRYIYRKAKLNEVFDSINIPILLDGILITPDKYQLLTNVRPENIKSVLLKENHKNIDNKYNYPFGILDVRLIKK